ncbi:MAG: sigma 54-interacting transcriptional regulator [Candidatus Krumholzibacteria bacterium]|nr:sigma 54-interacting transcriptional regulator [Candidatus Krumholzibacteria bacterium]
MSDKRNPTASRSPERDVPPELLLKMFNSVPEGIFAVDIDYRITAINDSALSALDLPRHRAVGSHCREVLRVDIGGEGCALRQAMESGQPTVSLETHFQDSLGNRLSVTLSTAAIKDNQGQVTGGVATFVNLADTRQQVTTGSPAGMFRDILTGDPNMKQLFEILPTISRSDSSILILGETGTGKNLIAKAIHRLSSRADGPLITVNCAALPETLLESELFGYKAGAFTGAHRDKPGRFAAAQGGTLFLDEIGDIPLGVQVKLLRVLQEKVYERLGEQVPIPCDIRFITATHRDLPAMVTTGTFRRDLYYRINVLNLEIPPLRDRKGDIPQLAQKFTEQLSLTRGKRVTGVSSAALELLMRHNYPGNVRELENILEHAWVMCLERVIDVQHLPRRLQMMAPSVDDTAAKGLEKVEGLFILQVLERVGWHRGRAAQELGIHRTTLQRKIRKLGLLLPAHDGRNQE